MSRRQTQSKASEDVVIESESHSVTEEDLCMAVLWDGEGSLHTDEEYSRRSAFGHRILQGDATLALSHGLMRQNAVFQKFGAWRSLKLSYTAPVFIGDAIRCRVSVVERPSPDVAIVNWQVVNQRGTEVVRARIQLETARVDSNES